MADKRRGSRYSTRGGASRSHARGGGSGNKKSGPPGTNRFTGAPAVAPPPPPTPAPQPSAPATQPSPPVTPAPAAPKLPPDLLPAESAPVSPAPEQTPAALQAPSVNQGGVAASDVPTAEAPADSIVESEGPKSFTEAPTAPEPENLASVPPAPPDLFEPADEPVLKIAPASLDEAPREPAQKPQLAEPTLSAPEPDVESAGPAPMLFEVAWEVCWQLGGIYTVLKTKAACMVDRWGEDYCLIGPYNPASADVEFEDQSAGPIMSEVLARLKNAGISARYGRWLVAGRPHTILIDHRSRYMRLHEDKYLLWKDHSISTPPNDGEVNDVVAFGFAVAEFFRILAEVVKDRPILAHFHEWMGGIAVPRIAHLRIPVATVFTTHATLLGRYLASDNLHYYEHLPFVDPDKEAAHFNIYPRYAIEKAAAHAATVFSTVSRVTALEAAKLLGRSPEAILPNGLNIERFTAIHEFQNLHRQYKERIHDFVTGHFFPAYEFDLDNTLYFFTSGRYEYGNKGMDMFIEAMARLNWRLKADRTSRRGEEGSDVTVVAFLVTRAQTRNINVGVLQSQTMFEELKQTIGHIQGSLGPVMLNAAAHGRFPTAGELFNEEHKIRWKRAVAAWKNRRQPAIVTHDLADDAHDPVLTHVRHRGLFNAADDPVKFIFHPDFMSVTSPLLHLDYDQFVRGCHMGIFPSYYEPWGYTPMEAIALGVPAVTSDLAGFGAYVQEHIGHHDENGIYVARRRNRGFDDACNDIVEQLYQFTRLSRRQRIELRNRVEGLGEKFDWSALISHYDEAHDLALARHTGRLVIRTV